MTAPAAGSRSAFPEKRKDLHYLPQVQRKIHPENIKADEAQPSSAFFSLTRREKTGKVIVGLPEGR